jgi:hypothetical protein
MPFLPQRTFREILPGAGDPYRKARDIRESRDEEIRRDVR